MKWVKAPEELKSVLEKAMTGIDCEKKPMFGYPAYFINRNMFAGMFGASVYFRLSTEQVNSLRKEYPSISMLEPMPGRPMKDYWAMPESLFKDERALRQVAKDSAAHARTLPPKAPKSKKPQSKKKA